MTLEEYQSGNFPPKKPEKPRFTAFYNRPPMLMQVSADSPDALAAKIAEIDQMLTRQGLSAVSLAR
jgi:hypothetical protein